MKESSHNFELAASPPVLGSQTALHPVLRLIHQRNRQRSEPLKRSDVYKLGLAVEGGGMRGIVSAGMLLALSYLDLLRVFDVVIGTSAGAINSAYFLSGQGPYGATIYYQNINNSRFIRKSRFLTGKPIMSLDFLVRHVMVHEKRLDCDSVLRSDVPLKVVATSVENATRVVFQDFRSECSLLDALRATTHMPFIAGKSHEVEGAGYVDGGIVEPIPYRCAVQDGCTHVLCLLTRPRGVLKQPPSALTRALYFALKRYYGEELIEAFLASSTKYNLSIREIEHCTKEPLSAPFIYGVQLPSGTQQVGRLEKGSDVLRAYAKLGMNLVFESFGYPTATISEVLCPFDRQGHLMRGDNNDNGSSRRL